MGKFIAKEIYLISLVLDKNARSPVTLRKCPWTEIFQTFRRAFLASFSFGRMRDIAYNDRIIYFGIVKRFYGTLKLREFLAVHDSRV